MDNRKQNIRKRLLPPSTRSTTENSLFQTESRIGLLSTQLPSLEGNNESSQASNNASDSSPNVAAHANYSQHGTLPQARLPFDTTITTIATAGRRKRLDIANLTAPKSHEDRWAAAAQAAVESKPIDSNRELQLQAQRQKIAELMWVTQARHLAEQQDQQMKRRRRKRSFGVDDETDSSIENVRRSEETSESVVSSENIGSSTSRIGDHEIEHGEVEEEIAAMNLIPPVDDDRSQLTSADHADVTLLADSGGSDHEDDNSVTSWNQEENDTTHVSNSGRRESEQTGASQTSSWTWHSGHDQISPEDHVYQLHGSPDQHFTQENASDREWGDASVFIEESKAEVYRAASDGSSDESWITGEADNLIAVEGEPEPTVSVTCGFPVEEESPIDVVDHSKETTCINLMDESRHSRVSMISSIDSQHEWTNLQTDVASFIANPDAVYVQMSNLSESVEGLADPNCAQEGTINAFGDSTTEVGIASPAHDSVSGESQHFDAATSECDGEIAELSSTGRSNEGDGSPAPDRGADIVKESEHKRERLAPEVSGNAISDCGGGGPFLDHVESLLDRRGAFLSSVASCSDETGLEENRVLDIHLANSTAINHNFENQGKVIEENPTCEWNAVSSYKEEVVNDSDVRQLVDSEVEALGDVFHSECNSEIDVQDINHRGGGVSDAAREDSESEINYVGPVGSDGDDEDGVSDCDWESSSIEDVLNASDADHAVLSVDQGVKPDSRWSRPNVKRIAYLVDEGTEEDPYSEWDSESTRRHDLLGGPGMNHVVEGATEAAEEGSHSDRNCECPRMEKFSHIPRIDPVVASQDEGSDHDCTLNASDINPIVESVDTGAEVDPESEWIIERSRSEEVLNARGAHKVVVAVDRTTDGDPGSDWNIKGTRVGDDTCPRDAFHVVESVAGSSDKSAKKWRSIDLQTQESSSLCSINHVLRAGYEDDDEDPNVERYIEISHTEDVLNAADVETVADELGEDPDAEGSFQRNTLAFRRALEECTRQVEELIKEQNDRRELRETDLCRRFTILEFTARPTDIGSRVAEFMNCLVETRRGRRSELSSQQKIVTSLVSSQDVRRSSAERDMLFRRKIMDERDRVTQLAKVDQSRFDNVFEGLDMFVKMKVGRRQKLELQRREVNFLQQEQTRRRCEVVPGAPFELSWHLGSVHEAADRTLTEVDHSGKLPQAAQRVGVIIGGSNVHSSRPNEKEASEDALSSCESSPSDDTVASWRPSFIQNLPDMPSQGSRSEQKRYALLNDSTLQLLDRKARILEPLRASTGSQESIPHSELESHLESEREDVFRTSMPDEELFPDSSRDNPSRFTPSLHFITQRNLPGDHDGRLFGDECHSDESRWSSDSSHFHAMRDHSGDSSDPDTPRSVASSRISPFESRAASAPGYGGRLSGDSARLTAFEGSGDFGLASSSEQSSYATSSSSLNSKRSRRCMSTKHQEQERFLSLPDSDAFRIPYERNECEDGDLSQGSQRTSSCNSRAISINESDCEATSSTYHTWNESMNAKVKGNPKRRRKLNSGRALDEWSNATWTTGGTEPTEGDLFCKPTQRFSDGATSHSSASSGEGTGWHTLLSRQLEWDRMNLREPELEEKSLSTLNTWTTRDGANRQMSLSADDERGDEDNIPKGTWKYRIDGVRHRGAQPWNEREHQGVNDKPPVVDTRDERVRVFEGRSANTSTELNRRSLSKYIEEGQSKHFVSALSSKFRGPAMEEMSFDDKTFSTWKSGPQASPFPRKEFHLSASEGNEDDEGTFASWGVERNLESGDSGDKMAGHPRRTSADDTTYYTWETDESCELQKQDTTSGTGAFLERSREDDNSTLVTWSNEAHSVKGRVHSSSLASLVLKQKTWMVQVSNRNLGIETSHCEEDSWKSGGHESEDSPLVEHLTTASRLLGDCTGAIDDYDEASASEEDTWKNSDGRDSETSSLEEHIENDREVIGDIGCEIDNQNETTSSEDATWNSDGRESQDSSLAEHLETVRGLLEDISCEIDNEVPGTSSSLDSFDSSEGVDFDDTESDCDDDHAWVSDEESDDVSLVEHVETFASFLEGSEVALNTSVVDHSSGSESIERNEVVNFDDSNSHSSWKTHEKQRAWPELSQHLDFYDPESDLTIRDPTTERSTADKLVLSSRNGDELQVIGAFRVQHGMQHHMLHGAALAEESIRNSSKGSSERVPRLWGPVVASTNPLIGREDDGTQKLGAGCSSLVHGDLGLLDGHGIVGRENEYHPIRDDSARSGLFANNASTSDRSRSSPDVSLGPRDNVGGLKVKDSENSRESTSRRSSRSIDSTKITIVDRSDFPHRDVRVHERDDATIARHGKYLTSNDSTLTDRSIHDRGNSGGAFVGGPAADLGDRPFSSVDGDVSHIIEHEGDGLNTSSDVRSTVEVEDDVVQVGVSMGSDPHAHDTASSYRSWSSRGISVSLRNAEAAVEVEEADDDGAGIRESTSRHSWSSSASSQTTADNRSDFSRRDGDMHERFEGITAKHEADYASDDKDVADTSIENAENKGVEEFVPSPVVVNEESIRSTDRDDASIGEREDDRSRSFSDLRSWVGEDDDAVLDSVSVRTGFVAHDAASSYRSWSSRGVSLSVRNVDVTLEVEGADEVCDSSRGPPSHRSWQSSSTSPTSAVGRLLRSLGDVGADDGEDVVRDKDGEHLIMLRSVLEDRSIHDTGNSGAAYVCGSSADHVDMPISAFECDDFDVTERAGDGLNIHSGVIILVKDEDVALRDLLTVVDTPDERVRVFEGRSANTSTELNRRSLSKYIEEGQSKHFVSALSSKFRGPAMEEMSFDDKTFSTWKSGPQASPFPRKEFHLSASEGNEDDEGTFASWGVERNLESGDSGDKMAGHPRRTSADDTTYYTWETDESCELQKQDTTSGTGAFLERSREDDNSTLVTWSNEAHSVKGRVHSSSLASLVLKQKTWMVQVSNRNLGIETSHCEEDSWKSGGHESEDSPLVEHLTTASRLLGDCTGAIDDYDEASASEEDTWKNSDGRDSETSSLEEHIENDREVIGDIGCEIDNQNETTSSEDATWNSDGRESQDSSLAEHLETVRGLLEDISCEIDNEVPGTSSSLDSFDSSEGVDFDDTESDCDDDHAWVSDEESDDVSLVEHVETFASFLEGSEVALNTSVVDHSSGSESIERNEVVDFDDSNSHSSWKTHEKQRAWPELSQHLDFYDPESDLTIRDPTTERSTADKLVLSSRNGDELQVIGAFRVQHGMQHHMLHGAALAEESIRNSSKGSSERVPRLWGPVVASTNPLIGREDDGAQKLGPGCSSLVHGDLGLLDGHGIVGRENEYRPIRDDSARSGLFANNASTSDRSRSSPDVSLGPRDNVGGLKVKDSENSRESTSRRSSRSIDSTKITIVDRSDFPHRDVRVHERDDATIARHGKYLTSNDSTLTDRSIHDRGNSGGAFVGGPAADLGDRPISSVDDDVSHIIEHEGDGLNTSSDVRSTVKVEDDVVQVGVSMGSDPHAHDTASSYRSWSSRGISVSLRNAEAAVEVEEADDDGAGIRESTSRHSWSSSASSQTTADDRSDFSRRDGDMHERFEGITAKHEADYASDDKDVADTSIENAENKGVEEFVPSPVVVNEESIRSTDRDDASIGEREDDRCRSFSDLRSWVGEDDDAVLHSVSVRTGFVAHDAASSYRSWSSRGVSLSVRNVDATVEVEGADEVCDSSRGPPSHHSWQSSSTSPTSAVGRLLRSLGDVGADEGEDVVRDKDGEHLIMLRSVLEDRSIHDRGNSGGAYVCGPAADLGDRPISSVDDDVSHIIEHEGDGLNTSSDVRSTVKVEDDVVQVGVSMGSDPHAHDTASSYRSWSSRGISVSLRNAEAAVEVEEADDDGAGIRESTSRHSWSSSASSQTTADDRSDFSRRDGDMHERFEGITAKHEADYASDDKDVADTSIENAENKGVEEFVPSPVVVNEESIRSTDRDDASIGEREDDRCRSFSDLRSWVGEDDDAVLHSVSVRTGFVAHDAASSYRSWSSRGVSLSVRNVDATVVVEGADEVCDSSRGPPSHRSWQSSSTSPTSAVGGSLRSLGDVGADEGEDVVRDKDGEHLIMLRSVLEDRSIHDRGNSGGAYVCGPAADLGDRPISSVDDDVSHIIEHEGDGLNTSSDVRSTVKVEDDVVQVGVSMGSDPHAHDTASSYRSWSSRGISVSLRNAEAAVEVEEADDDGAGIRESTSRHSWSSSASSQTTADDRSDFSRRDGDMHERFEGITAKHEADYASDDKDVADTSIENAENKGVEEFVPSPVVVNEESIRSTDRDDASIGEREDDRCRSFSDLRSWVGEDDDAVLHSVSVRTGFVAHDAASSYRSWSSRGVSLSVRNVDATVVVEGADEVCDSSRGPPSHRSWQSSSTSPTSAVGGSLRSLGDVGADEGEDVVRDKDGEHLIMLRSVLEDRSIHDRGNSGGAYVCGPAADLGDRPISSVDDDVSHIIEHEGDGLNTSSDVRSTVKVEDDVVQVGVSMGSDPHAHDTASSFRSWSSRGISVSLRNAEAAVEVEEADDDGAGIRESTSPRSWSSSASSQTTADDRSDFSRRDGDMHERFEGITAKPEADYASDDKDVAGTSIENAENKGLEAFVPSPVVVNEESIRSTDRDDASIGEREDDRCRSFSDLRSWVGEDNDAVLHSVSVRTGFVAHDAASSYRSWSSRGVSLSVRNVDATVVVEGADEVCDSSRGPPSHRSWQSSSTSPTSAVGGSLRSLGDVGADEGEDVVRDKDGEHLIMLRSVLEDRSIHDRGNSGAAYVCGSSADHVDMPFSSVGYDVSHIIEHEGDGLNTSSDVRSTVKVDDDVAEVGGSDRVDVFSLGDACVDFFHDSSKKDNSIFSGYVDYRDAVYYQNLKADNSGSIAEFVSLKSWDGNASRDTWTNCSLDYKGSVTTNSWASGESDVILGAELYEVTKLSNVEFVMADSKNPEAPIDEDCCESGIFSNAGESSPGEESDGKIADTCPEDVKVFAVGRSDIDVFCDGLATPASENESSESTESSSSGLGGENSDTVSEEAVPSSIRSRQNSGSVFSDLSSGVDVMKNEDCNAACVPDVKNSTAGVAAGNLFVVPTHTGTSYGLLEDPAYELDFGDSKFDDLSGKWGARKEKYEALYESTVIPAQPVAMALKEEFPASYSSKDLEKSKAPKSSFWPLKMFSLNLPAKKLTTEYDKDFSNVIEVSHGLPYDKERKNIKKKLRYSALTTTQIPAFNEPLNARVDKNKVVPVFVSSSAINENKPKGSLTFFRRADIVRRGEPFGRNLKFFEGTQGHSTTGEDMTQPYRTMVDGSESADGLKQCLIRDDNQLRDTATFDDVSSEHPDKEREHAIATPGHSPSPPGSLEFPHTEHKTCDVRTLAVAPSRDGEMSTIVDSADIQSSMPPVPRNDDVFHSLIAVIPPFDLDCIASDKEKTVNENSAGGNGKPQSISDGRNCDASIPAQWGLGKAKLDGELLVSWGEMHDSNSKFGESGSSRGSTDSEMGAKAEDQRPKRLAPNRSPYSWQDTELSYDTSCHVDHVSATPSEVDVDAVSWTTPVLLPLEQLADGLPPDQTEGVDEDVPRYVESVDYVRVNLESIPASPKVGCDEVVENNGPLPSYSIRQMSPSLWNSHMDTGGNHTGEMLLGGKDDREYRYDASSLGHTDSDMQQERIGGSAFTVVEGNKVLQEVQQETLTSKAHYLQGVSTQHDPEGIPKSSDLSDLQDVSNQDVDPQKVQHGTLPSSALFDLEGASDQHDPEGILTSNALSDQEDVSGQLEGVVEHKIAALFESDNTNDFRHAFARTSPRPEKRSRDMQVDINDGGIKARRGETETAAISARHAELDHVLELSRDDRLDDNSMGSSDADASESYPLVNFSSEGMESSASAGLDAANLEDFSAHGEETPEVHNVNPEYNNIHFGSSYPLRTAPLPMMDNEVPGNLSDDRTHHSIASSGNAGIDGPFFDEETEQVSTVEPVSTLVPSRQRKVTIVEVDHLSNLKTLNPASDSETRSGSSSGTDSGTYFGSSYSGSYSDSDFSRSNTTSESNSDSSYRETYSEDSAAASGSTGDSANSDLENQISSIPGVPSPRKALLHVGSKSDVQADGGARKPAYSKLYTPERIAFLMRNITQSKTPLLSVDTDVVPDLEVGATRKENQDNEAPQRNPMYMLAHKYSSLNFGIDTFSDEMDEENQAMQSQKMPPCCSRGLGSWKLWTIMILGVVLIISIALGVSLTGSNPSPSTQAPSPPTFAPTLAFENRAWMQLGDAFEGVDLRDQAGFVVALSTDGSTLAIGARRSSADGLINRGNVKVYRFEFHRWYLIGDLHGIDARNQFGFSVSISENGERLAIGSVGDDTNGNNSGMVEVYEYQASRWTKIGQFYGSAAGDIFGTSVSLSADGRLVAVGAPYSSGAGGLPRSGEVSFFEDIGFADNPRWVESRQKISGAAGNDFFGWSVSLSSDGYRVAIGAPLDGVRTDPGYVSVFAYTEINDEWTKLGQSLNNGEGGDRFGNSVSIDRTGSRLAVGAFRGTNGLGVATGNARVFGLDGEIWVSVGQILAGESESCNFGYAVSLTPEGDFLAVGAPNQNNSPGTGMASVFTLVDATNWVSSIPIKSDVDQSSLGFSVSLMSSATMIAVGMPTANEARVYA